MCWQRKKSSWLGVIFSLLKLILRVPSGILAAHIDSDKTHVNLIELKARVSYELYKVTTD